MLPNTSWIETNTWAQLTNSVRFVELALVKPFENAGNPQTSSTIDYLSLSIISTVILHSELLHYEKETSMG